MFHLLIVSGKWDNLFLSCVFPMEQSFFPIRRNMYSTEQISLLSVMKHKYFAVKNVIITAIQDNF